MAESTQKLANLGTNAIFGIGGAIALSAVSFFTGMLIGPVGIISGAVLGVLGLSGVLSRSSTDKKDGLVVTGIGAVLLGIGFNVAYVPGIANWIFGTGSTIALIWGIVSGVRFFLGMRKRT